MFLKELGALGEEVDEKLAALKERLAELRSSPDDDKTAFVFIRHGSGGAEARAWSAMLLRMHCRYAERKGLVVEMMDVDPDDTGGIRTALLRISGKRAFALFRDEAGVHRLSRVSPFDHANRRQTSFCKVEVFPEEVRSLEIVVPETDLECWFCGGGGPGGQKVNKTEMVAVVRHLPTGIMVRCQASRSRTYNKQKALEILKSKLVRLKQEKEERQRKIARAEARLATFGNRDRTYILSQGRLVHDHRTGKKTEEVERVLDGELDLIKI